MASGPSLRLEDVELLRPHVSYCVAVNNTMFDVPWADEGYFSDFKWLKNYRAERPEFFQNFKGRLVSGNNCGPDIERVRFRNWVRNGGNSGHQGMQRAVDTGYRKLVLVGFDHQHTGGKAHYHPDHPGKLHNAKGCVTWRKHMNKTADDLKRRGVQVVNASRKTALMCFEPLQPELFIERYCRK